MKLFTFIASTNRSKQTNHKERSQHQSRVIFLLLGIAISLSLFSWHSQKEKPLSKQTFLAQANIETTSKEAGISFVSPKEMGETTITISRESIKVKATKSINKVIGIHPKNDQQLNATLAFQYNESDLNGLDEKDLILYSSQDKGTT